MKQIDILKYFINNPNLCLKTKNLSDYFGVSEKTIYNNIAQINNILKDNCVQIENNPKKGFYLDSNNVQKIDLNLFKKMSSDKEARYRSMIGTLLSITQSIKISFLADMFYLSESQIKKDLKEVKQILDKYNLNLKSGVKGIAIIGDEKDKRKCIIKEHIATYSLDDLLHDNEGIVEEIDKIIKQEIEFNHFSISEQSYKNLLVHIYVALKRMQKRDMIDSNNFPNINKAEYDMACSIYKKLSEKYNFKYNEEEIEYLAFNIMGKKNYDFSEKQDKEVQNLVLSIINEIKQITGLNFKDDDLVETLTLHFMPLNVRINADMPLQNPLLSEIKKKYPLAYEIGVVASTSYAKFTGKVLNEDEVSFLALHFLMALVNNQEKKKIMLISDQRYGNIMLLKQQILSKFSNEITDFKIVNKTEIQNQKLDDYILLTTDNSLANELGILHVNELLNYEDFKNIRKEIRGNKSAAIQELIKNESYFEIAENVSKEEVIRFLCEKSSEIYHTEDMFHKVMKREKFGCTGLDNKIAIPHPDGLTANKTFVTVAVLKSSIDWDGKPVRIVFLISIKKGEKEKMSEIFNSISSLVQSPDLVERFLEEPSCEKLINILGKAEEEFNER